MRRLLARAIAVAVVFVAAVTVAQYHKFIRSTWAQDRLQYSELWSGKIPQVNNIKKENKRQQARTEASCASDNNEKLYLSYLANSFLQRSCTDLVPSAASAATLLTSTPAATCSCAFRSPFSASFVKLSTPPSSTPFT